MFGIMACNLFKNIAGNHKFPDLKKNWTISLQMFLQMNFLYICQNYLLKFKLMQATKVHESRFDDDPNNCETNANSTVYGWSHFIP